MAHSAYLQLCTPSEWAEHHLTKRVSKAGCRSHTNNPSNNCRQVKVAAHRSLAKVSALGVTPTPTGDARLSSLRVQRLPLPRGCKYSAEMVGLIQGKPNPLPQTSQMCIKNQGPEPESILGSRSQNSTSGFLHCLLSS